MASVMMPMPESDGPTPVDCGFNQQETHAIPARPDESGYHAGNGMKVEGPADSALPAEDGCSDCVDAPASESCSPRGKKKRSSRKTMNEGREYDEAVPVEGPDLSCFAPDEARAIRRRAKQMVGKAKLTKSDLSDLIQDLAIELLKRLPHFDPGKGSREDFVRNVLGKAAATILERRQAEMRSPYREAMSLSVRVVEKDEEYELSDLVPEESRLTDKELFELEHDWGIFTVKLTPQEQDVCERYKYKSIQQVADDLQVNRSTVYRRLRAIGEQFASDDIRDYL